MTRNVKLDKPITRTVSTVDVTKDSTLMCTMLPPSTFKVAERPDRRLKRGEQLPTKELDICDWFYASDTPDPTSKLIKDMFSRLCVAGIDYAAKVEVLRVFGDVFGKSFNVSLSSPTRQYIRIDGEWHVSYICDNLSDADLQAADDDEIMLLDTTDPAAVKIYSELEWRQIENNTTK